VVFSITVTRSALSVARERSNGSSEGLEVPKLAIRVEPWPRASKDRTPAAGSSLRISAVRVAKERPEEPAPWCVTKREAEPVGEVR
jgi:hypothetical protein